MANVKFFNMKEADFLSKRLLYKYTELIDSISLDPRIGENTIELLRREFETTYGFAPVSKSQRRVQRSLLYAAEKPVVLKL